MPFTTKLSVKQEPLYTPSFTKCCPRSNFSLGVLLPLQGRYCQEIEIDANYVAQMFFFNGLASTISRAVTGRLCDIRRDCPVWIMRVTVFVSGTMVILMTLWSSYKQLLACFVVYGMMDGAFASSMNVLVLSTLSPKQKSQGIGFLHFCVSSMLVAGPPFGGRLLF